ncbi:OLC1v1002306C1 [Oldenlandia corymbosa var. corymbosa]|uniref:ferric-chelate reductase (NADH) n=1 Tax=Oldenlandia corymbosa var. corymbosa TaxID=529605 RepID=A0AAV1D7E9_OLDCO|nr:OLC1v1002306C1 [Oldenlandia corymbosa var. corymbosa]
MNPSASKKKLMAMDSTVRPGAAPPKSPTGDTKNAIQAMIMGLIVVVTVGYMFLWIMLPTNVYRLKWLPKIQAKANTTYFGTQGTNILIFTFPVLFVAALGCVYLHLRKKSTVNGGHYHHSNGENNGLAAWKRPMIIKGLGVISLIELAFLVMFVALIAWYFSLSLRIKFHNITPMSAAKTGEKVWQAKLDATGLRFGIAGNICLAFLFFPVARGSSVLQLFGLTSEASIKYHMWMGHITMAVLTAHGVCYVIYWSVTHQISQMLKWPKMGESNVAGEIALLAGLAMWATTFSGIRRKFFELFFYTHYLYIVFMLFFLLHAGLGHFSYGLASFYLFLVDRYLRFLQSRQNVRLVSARILPGQTLELNFSKAAGLTYTPTSIMFLNVPSISKLQWHPFTITSSCNLEPEKLSVIIKGEVSWTNKLHQLLSSPSSSVDHLAVSVEGPYGPSSTDFLRHDLLVMVSGGSGITPFISIIRELIYTSETQNYKTPSILLIPAFKNSSDLTVLNLILPIHISPSQISNLDLQIDAYVTREKQPPSSSSEEEASTKKNITTIWFKPKPTDSPISPVLGQNGWLWLGAIISASFMMYLVLIGIITRYYFYPKDIHHDGMNMMMMYSSSSKYVVNLLFLCVSIVFVATVVFLWNKKQNAMENKQIQHLEGATPEASPASLFYNADRELESGAPQQSLAFSTNVHYGERPDLKRILFERKESSVGVLVCGPKKMRHEVANICSSGLGANLHFESISFSW